MDTQTTLWDIVTPQPLPGWLTWTDNDGTPVYRHSSTTYTLRGFDAYVQAQEVTPWLAFLEGWAVGFVENAPHNVNPWMAWSTGDTTRPALFAASLQRLALAAHHVGKTEMDYPDVDATL